MIELVKYKDQSIYLENLQITNNTSITWTGCSSAIKNIFSSIFMLSRDFEGSILYKGKNIKELDNYEYFNFINDYSLVFDRGGLLSNKNLRDNILLPFLYHKKESRILEGEIDSYFSQAGYKEYLNNRPSYAPENLRKFTTLLRAVLWQPKVLFVENFSMGLEVADVKFFEDLLDKKNIKIHYYDSLDKFFVKESDIININKEKMVVA